MATADVDCDDSIVAVACYFYIGLLDEQYKVSRRPNRRHDGAKKCKFWDPFINLVYR